MRRLALAAALAAALAPLAPAHADCYQKVLLERHDGYTVVNVPTGRCGTTSVTVPVGI